MKKNPKAYLFVLLRRYFRLKGIRFTFGNHTNTIFIEPNQHLPTISLFFDEQENYVHIRTWPNHGAYSVAIPANISLELFLYKLHKYNFINDKALNNSGTHQENGAMQFADTDTITRPDQDMRLLQRKSF